MSLRVEDVAVGSSLLAWAADSGCSTAQPTLFRPSAGMRLVKKSGRRKAPRSF